MIDPCRSNHYHLHTYNLKTMYKWGLLSRKKQTFTLTVHIRTLYTLNISTVQNLKSKRLNGYVCTCILWHLSVLKEVSKACHFIYITNFLYYFMHSEFTSPQSTIIKFVYQIFLYKTLMFEKQIQNTNI